MNKRVLYGALAVLLVAVAFVSQRNSTSSISVSGVRHKIDLVASVNAVSTDTGWSQEGTVTSGGSIRLSLDDLRTFTVQSGTLVANYSGVNACTDFVTPNACVFLADMLGDAVVWFALVAADKASGQEFLTLPGLVDMQANGDEGILRNGWIVKLATPVKRMCTDKDTSSLRDFITRFPDTASTASLNLITDNIVSVNCV
ncbi:unannotated protein [freshwater metagenome]|uniref:Unannotated protein n=1 Tax=freshwater metagenome TaxID=449393 RepID=A0A6J6H2I0_9ZZZZ|nr:hypothetical protein [Actinomycetota bacterium]